MTSMLRAVSSMVVGIAALVSGAVSPVHGQQGWLGHGHHSRQRCPQCACEFCELEVKKDKIEKTCFKVETKTICIPPVWLPWQKCPPTAAATRKVCELVEDSYECPTCKYTWKLVEPCAPADGAKNESAATPPWLPPPGVASQFAPRPISPDQANPQLAPFVPPIVSSAYYDPGQ